MRTRLMLLAIIIVTGAMFSFNAPAQLVVTSTAFRNNAMIPVKYSCEGDEVNPPLHIEHIPANAQSVAVIMHDPDAPARSGFTHWVVWNLGTDGNVPENYRGGMQGQNSGEKNG